MKLPVLTLDFETDPFEYEVEVRPFAWDIYDGESHTTYWGQDCLKKLETHLKRIKPSMIFAHNGGKFDFMFMLPFLDHGKMFVIGGRIVEAKCFGHILRDSYAMMPVPLKDMDKDEIDYEKMKGDVRDHHKDEIIAYLKQDTKGLFGYVKAYQEEFGSTTKTMASAAIRELKKFHSYQKMNANSDRVFRQYFHGGRVQCFEAGVIRTRGIQVFDVNSMYPSVMKNFLHPVGNTAVQNWRITNATNFVTFRGVSRGALPVQDGEKKHFPNDRKERIWHTTIHEYRAGIETGTIEPKELIYTWEFAEQASFGDFIDHFYEYRMQAAARGDEIHKLFYKLVMNSSYGKFAQNPENYYDYYVSGQDDPPQSQCWHLDGKDKCSCQGWQLYSDPRLPTVMWRKKAAGAKFKGFHNVATAASITGAARSLLLRAIVSSKSPLYCDTDSLICKGLGSDSPVDAKLLGAWKLEKTGDMIAIAGRKTYALFDGDKCVKQATKGVRLTPQQIIQVAMGDTVEYRNPAPKLGFSGEQKFIKRNVRRT